MNRKLMQINSIGSSVTAIMQVIKKIINTKMLQINSIGLFINVLCVTVLVNLFRTKYIISAFI